LNAYRRTPSVADTYGHVLTLAQLLSVLKLSHTTAKRMMSAGTFPIPALPRHGDSHKRSDYRFAAVQVDRYLDREMDKTGSSARVQMRRSA